MHARVTPCKDGPRWCYKPVCYHSCIRHSNRAPQAKRPAQLLHLHSENVCVWLHFKRRSMSDTPQRLYSPSSRRKFWATGKWKDNNARKYKYEQNSSSPLVLMPLFKICYWFWKKELVGGRCGPTVPDTKRGLQKCSENVAFKCRLWDMSTQHISWSD